MNDQGHPPEGDLTTLYVRRAAGGDPDGVAWIIERFTPVLLAQAEYRLGRNFRRAYDPEDLVNDVWAVALPRLGGLSPRGGRITPVVMKFLSTTLLHRFSALVRKQLRAGAVEEAAPAGENTGGPDPVDALPAETLGVITRVVREETRRGVAEAIDELGDTEREILILRGVEQNPVPFIASTLGLTENAVYLRYHRALKKLRRRLEGSVFEEFPADRPGA